MSSNRPKVGLGVLLFNSSKQMLMGKRKNSHGEHTWGNPGGHLEFGESFEDCAVREVLEETGVTIEDPQFIGITNNVLGDTTKHYVSIFMAAKYPQDQDFKNLEPHKNGEWCWIDLHNLPSPLFVPLDEILKRESALNKIHQTLDVFFPKESIA